MIRLMIFLVLIANIAYGEYEGSENDLEQRVNELTDKVEQLTHQNNLLQKKIDALGADIEYRFKEVQQGAASPVKTESVAPVAAVKPGKPENAKAEFDKAYELLKAQEYAKAEEALSLYVKAFPNNEYTGNAYYWLGESFALRKKYDKAAINYIISFNKFPKNNKADLSMIKLVNALNALGKKKEACATLAKLKAKKASLYPVMKKLLQREESKIVCK